MKSLLLSLALLSLGVASVRAAAPETLTLADLSRHPERWPDKIVASRDYSFSGGAKVRKGQSLRVVEISGANVAVEAGAGLVFEIPLQESGVLAAANAAWAKLTPAQRQVDIDTLVTTPALWPERVRCVNTLQFDGGRLAAGTEVPLLSCTRNEVNVFVESANTTLSVEWSATDLVARARERALLAPEKRSSRVLAALQGKLTDAKGQSFDDKAYAEAQVFVLYYSASWCGPCHKFSPSLVEFVKKSGAQNPKMAVIMMSNDKSDAALQGYMREQRMPWPVMPLAQLQKTPMFLSFSKGSIPQLLVLDRHGRVLSDSYKGNTYVGPQVALQELARLVGTGVAQ